MKQTWFRKSCHVPHRWIGNELSRDRSDWQCQQTDWVDRCRVSRAGKRLFWGWSPALEGS